MRPFVLPHRTNPTAAHSTNEFFKASGNLLRGFQKNGRTQSPCKLPVRPRNEFPPGIPQRVALQQSPPPLRRPDHPANPKCPALPTTRFANPRHRKTTGTSTQLLAQCKVNQGRIFYLRIARSLSQRSGPPQTENSLKDSTRAGSSVDSDWLLTVQLQTMTAFGSFHPAIAWKQWKPSARLGSGQSLSEPWACTTNPTRQTDHDRIQWGGLLQTPSKAELNPRAGKN